MKKMYILAFFAFVIHGLSGAAASSRALPSGVPPIADFLQNAKTSVPYLDILLNPEEILMDPSYFAGEDYERTDLINFANEEKKRLKPTRIFLLAQVFLGKRSLDDFMQKDFASGIYLDDTLALLQACIDAPTMIEAVRQLTIGALKKRLDPVQGNVFQAFFSPLNTSSEETKIEETILWLIRSENKNIKIASYFFTNKNILKELANAVLRGVGVEIIVDEKSERENLDILGLTYWTWKHSNTSYLKMHHKFMLFESNFDHNSIVVNGSFNLTPTANRNHENILVFNDKALFAQFVRRFQMVKSLAQAAPTVYFHSSLSNSLSVDFFGSQSASYEESLSQGNIDRSELPQQNWPEIAKKLLQMLENKKEVLQIYSQYDQSLLDPSAKRPRRD